MSVTRERTEALTAVQRVLVAPKRVSLARGACRPCLPGALCNPGRRPLCALSQTVVCDVVQVAFRLWFPSRTSSAAGKLQQPTGSARWRFLFLNVLQPCPSRIFFRSLIDSV